MHIYSVVICFQISIFEPLKTAYIFRYIIYTELWFAFKLVSLNHWKQLFIVVIFLTIVVICFQISIFEPLKTAFWIYNTFNTLLWFAFKLVSLNHWKQHFLIFYFNAIVVICFQISIFEPLKTALFNNTHYPILLWFAFKLVSLNHWKQLK